MILQVFYSFFSGILLSLALPNELFLLGCPVISFFALIPYYLAIKKCKTFRQAFASGFIQTITTHLCSSFWLAFFKDFAVLTLGASALATGVLGGIFGCFLFFPQADKYNKHLYIYSLSRKFDDSPVFRIIWFSTVYVVYEFAKSIGFIGYPWGTLSATMFTWKPIMQIADITGTYGISFIAVLFNTLLCETILNFAEAKKLVPSRRFSYSKEIIHPMCFFALIFSITLIYGHYQLNKKRTPLKSLNAVILQQNSDPWKMDDDEEIICELQKLAQKEIDSLKQKNKNAQLLIFSEGSLVHSLPSGFFIYEREPYPESLTHFLRRNNVPLLTGAAVTEKIPIDNSEDDYLNRYYNAAVVIDTNEELRAFYGKLHLVPFAEYVPGSEKPFIRKLMKKIVGFSAGWTKGKNITYFDIPCTSLEEKSSSLVKIEDISISKYDQEQRDKKTTVRVATPICFDDAFTDVMRPLSRNGAELFINLTDDSWSLKKSSEYQHFCVSSYRSIEYRTTFVRSTNAGYSVVLDPCGRIIADLPLFEQAALSCEVPVYTPQKTVYSLFGNWLVYFMKVILTIYAVYRWKKFTKDDFIASERKRKIKVKTTRSKKFYKKLKIEF
ncbi:MAG: apolipoprotein N-acyltransferase [Treponema sp.]|nr:apolipoprotein N-acyltransferase [Treponema sp.]